jgi:hypothetical protein
VRRFDAVLEPFGPAAAVTLPFDPKAEWGKVRAPVRGTIDGHPFSTTVARYGGVDYLAFRREVREAASVEVGAVVTIEVELDTSERVVTVPRTSSPRLRTAVCARRSTRSVHASAGVRVLGRGSQA